MTRGTQRANGPRRTATRRRARAVGVACPVGTVEILVDESPVSTCSETSSSCAVRLARIHEPPAAITPCRLRSGWAQPAALHRTALRLSRPRPKSSVHVSYWPDPSRLSSHHTRVNTRTHTHGSVRLFRVPWAGGWDPMNNTRDAVSAGCIVLGRWRVVVAHVVVRLTGPQRG